MDFKFNGRAWAGNIYHRFETMCQEVDDFVTKDSVKYVENQVHTVGEGMKKLYSNVVHDLLPPVVNKNPNEGSLATEKQNDMSGSSIRSVVDINRKHGRANERKSFKEQGNDSEVGYQRQHSLPPNLEFHQAAETDFHSEGSGNICISMNADVVHGENVRQEESILSRFSSSQDKQSSLDLKEQEPLPESLDSPVDEKVSWSTDSDDRYQRSIFLTHCSPEKFVDNVDIRTSHNDETVSNSDDLSEEAKNGLSLEQDGFNAIHNNTKMGPEDNSANKEHPVSEGANAFEEKYSSELISCAMEQHQAADDLHFLQDENLLVLSSGNEDFKSSIHELSPVRLGHDIGFKVVPMEETIRDNIDPSMEAGANLSSQHDNVGKHGVSLDENIAEHVPPVVECKSLSNENSCLKLSLCSREQNPLLEGLSNPEDENASESSLVSTNENPNVTTSAEFHPETSVHDQELGDFQDKESPCDILGPTEVEEKDLFLEIGGDSTCMYSDLSGKENHMLINYVIEESISSLELKSSSDLSLYSTKQHVQAEESDSSEDDNWSKSSTPLSDQDHKITVLTNLSQAMSVHDGEFRAFQMDETICSRNPSSELVPSNIYDENKIDQAEFTSLTSSVSIESLNLPNTLNAPYSQKAEKSCYKQTDSSVCVSNISSMSSESFSDLANDNKVVNLIPAYLGRPVSAVPVGDDDSAVDITDPHMETINLSDEVKLDEICIIVDNSLRYASSSRPRKFRSYKKLIQDAFASRKRLIKEYEQLAIWYGDIETETCLHLKQCHLPPIIDTTSSSRTSQASDMSEPEWELL